MNVSKTPVYIRNKNFKNKGDLCMSWGDGLTDKITGPAPSALNETTDSRELSSDLHTCLHSYTCLYTT